MNKEMLNVFLKTCRHTKQYRLNKDGKALFSWLTCGDCLLRQIREIPKDPESRDICWAAWKDLEKNDKRTSNKIKRL
jgi:hypothetical protein